MTFNWSNPYSVTRSPVFARNVVATSHPLAAQAGLTMLQRGGNAVDAAVATAAAMTIVEPVSNGLGSDCFALVWDPARSPSDRLQGLNASGVAPAAWNVDYFERKYGGVFPMRGWDAVTVPGCVAGWAALSRRFGTLPFGDLIAPAIDLAARGHGVAPIVAQKWALQVPVMQAQPGFAESFMPRGRAPLPGERFVFGDAAATLATIARTHGESFYRGEIAERLIAHSAAHGGAMTLSDLANFEVDWVTPIAKACTSANGSRYALHEIPPNGQGIAALMALGMVEQLAEQLGFGRDPVDSVETQHLLIEAMKLAFADVYRYVADHRHMTEVTTAHLLDDSYLASRARLIDASRASDALSGVPQQFVRPGGTIYLATADAGGMMVSLIQSNYMGFGSGVVVPGTGISLQNRGHCFSLTRSHPNVVAGGKRPFHTIIPGFLTREIDGTSLPQMSFGVMGGNMQPQGHLQTLIRMLKYGQQPQAACDAPRWKVNASASASTTVDTEKTMAAELRQALIDRGHIIESIADPYMDFGSGQFIWKLSDDAEDGYVAASDSRRDGQAVGF